MVHKMNVKTLMETSQEYLMSCTNIIKFSHKENEDKEFKLKKLIKYNKELWEVRHKETKKIQKSNDFSSFLYRELLFNATQKQRNAKGLKKNREEFTSFLAPILFDFNPKKVLDVYQGNERELITSIIEQMVKKQVHLTAEDFQPRSAWMGYLKTAYDCATFCSDNTQCASFFEMLELSQKGKLEDILEPALLLDKEIFGYGIMLACNFAKELGYKNYLRIDNNSKEIYVKAGLISEHQSDMEALVSLLIQCKKADITPFEFDRVIWTIGSGYFEIPDKKNGGWITIETNKENFLTNYLPTDQATT